MRLEDKVIVVTGGGSGIGEGMARRFAREFPRGLVVADIDLDRVTRVAEQIGAHPVRTDVSEPEDNRRLVEETEDRFGPVDLFCANAGFGATGDEQTDPDEWNRMWQVNVMSHVHAARFLMPGWLASGEGYFLSTASAAGLLTNLKAAQYSVTKHAAVAFAEWLAIAYGRRGLKVSCLCPQAVITGMYKGDGGSAGVDGALSAEQVAGEIVKVMGEERFLVLPHPTVLDYMRNKTADYDRWIGGMQKLYAKHQGEKR